MAKNTVDADKICDLAKSTLKQLDEMITKIDSVKRAIDKMAEGDGTMAYWSGDRALEWYAASYKNVANSYIRVAKIADAMRVEILYGIDSFNKDKNDTSKAKLNTLKGQFMHLRDQAKREANKISPAGA